ncbi:MAG: hypothetical protein IT340_10925 [Chloroflexi bacterium]|nr:hypothetical protein [Chloroflexota bacterium]
MSLTSDTLPDAERALIAGFRRMPGWRKLQRVADLNALTCALALADIRRRHPDAGERELRLRLAARRLGPALVRERFDWRVEREGY